LDLEVNHQGSKGEIENNHKNGREYVRITQTPYRNLMLDMQVLRKKKRHARHKLFLPQEAVRHEVWTSGL
jgi:hypothetical protein